MGEPGLTALGRARELERRDGELLAAARELEELEREVSAIRTRVAAISAFLATLPEQRARLVEALRRAEAELDSRQERLRDAEAKLAEAERRGASDEVAAARRTLAEATDAASAAQRARDELAARQRQLEDEATAHRNEVPELELRAERVNARVEGSDRAGVAPRLERGLGGLEPWGARARSELFVARAALQREREALMGEASELGSRVLGEPVYASSVALVRQRLERALVGTD